MKSLIVSMLALAVLLAGAACLNNEKNCDDHAASIQACYACVGVEDRGGTLYTPCRSFTFTQGSTCRCTR